MDKLKILLAEHNVLAKSAEWNFDAEGYYQYVDGVVDLASELLSGEDEQC